MIIIIQESRITPMLRNYIIREFSISILSAEVLVYITCDKRSLCTNFDTRQLPVDCHLGLHNELRLLSNLKC